MICPSAIWALQPPLKCCSFAVPSSCLPKLCPCISKPPGYVVVDAMQDLPLRLAVPGRAFDLLLAHPNSDTDKQAEMLCLSAEFNAQSVYAAADGHAGTGSGFIQQLCLDLEVQTLARPAAPQEGNVSGEETSGSLMDKLSAPYLYYPRWHSG